MGYIPIPFEIELPSSASGAEEQREQRVIIDLHYYDYLQVSFFAGPNYTKYTNNQYLQFLYLLKLIAKTLKVPLGGYTSIGPPPLVLVRNGHSS